MLGLISLEKEGAAIAAQYHEQALLIGRELGDKYLEVAALSNLAYAIGVAQGDYFVASDYFEQAYSLSCELGNWKGQGLTLSNMGWLNGILGNYPKAVKYLEQALIVSQKIGERSSQINMYINLSAFAGAQGNISGAIEWAEKALALSTELKDRTGSGWAYFYLGHAYLLNNQFDEALNAFLQSIEIRLEISIPVLVAEARAGLLEVYLKMEDSVSAHNLIASLLEYMDTDIELKGAEEPLRIFLALYRSLEKEKDQRALIVLQNAIQLLSAQASKLRSETARQMYVNNVPWRHEIYLIAKGRDLID
jgi:tetratricopeptide (TPR) repeat protein